MFFFRCMWLSESAGHKSSALAQLGKTLQKKKTKERRPPSREKVADDVANTFFLVQTATGVYLVLPCFTWVYLVPSLT